MGFSVSPLLTQSLVHVPLPRAADASGLLTTTIQLSQVLGVAILGTVFLSLPRQADALSAAAKAHGSAAALTVTTYWLVSLALIGVAAGIGLSRTVLRSRRSPVPVA
jgi:hypothetical protein